MNDPRRATGAPAAAERGIGAPRATALGGPAGRSPPVGYDPGRVSPPRPDGDRRRAGRRRHVRPAQGRRGGAPVLARPGRKRGERLHAGGPGGSAREAPRAGARDDGQGRGLRTPEQRDHRQHDLRPHGRRNPRRRPDPQSGCPAAAGPPGRRLEGRLPRSAGLFASFGGHRGEPDRQRANRPAGAAVEVEDRSVASGRHRFADSRRARRPERRHLPLH